MKEYHPQKLATVAVLGHSGSGKTSIVEAMAYRAGSLTRLGKIADGNTISDYDEEEIRRKVSIHTSVVPVYWQDCKINLLDTPGYFDFVGEVKQALRVSEAALIVVPASTGLGVGTIQSMKYAEDKPKMIYVSQIDDKNADYNAKLQELKETFGRAIAPIQVPMMENGKMIGYVNVAKMEGRLFKGEKTEVIDIPESMMDEVAPVREMILEAVAETSDEFLEKYMMGEEFTREEISWALRQGVMNRTLVPVLCGTNTIGIQIILNSMVAFFPAASDTVNSFVAKYYLSGEEDVIGYDESLPVSAFVFKTIADPFMGKISIFKVCTGSVNVGQTLYNPKKQEYEKINKLFVIRGKDLVEVETLHAGDVGALTKLQYTETNDTLHTFEYKVMYEDIDFPQPFYSKGVSVKKGNEDKLMNAINRMLDEDKTLRFENNTETKQQVLSGMGDQHLDIVLSQIKSKYKLEVTLEDLVLPYRETIKGKATVRGKHKKQSGGHGQYGDVEITFEPSGDLNTPYVFEEKVFGGAVPKNYFPAVEKGLEECCKKGVLAGYPVVGLKATLIDGSYHDVDSSEMAFKLATSIAYKDGLPKAKPVLLEPFTKVVVTTTDDYTGDIMSDFSKKRGRVLGMNHLPNGDVEVEAEVPMAEMLNYAIDLRALSQGRSSYVMEFLGYEEAPYEVSQKIIEANK